MIVVVDDEPDAADILVRLLRRTGHEAVSHACADDLFGFLRANTPDLIILDVNMPEIDGIACLGALREHAAWRHIPVIMYSADSGEMRIQEARRLGAREYVVKGTFRWPEFADLIKRHLPGPQAPPSGA